MNMIKSVLFTCLVAAVSAEADADAAYLGYGYPYAHGLYGYAHVPFGSSTGLDPITQGLDPVTQGAVPYYGYAHAGYHYGKRSADAEPKADAAYLGYGYPYAYGAYAAHVPFGSSTGLDPITQGLDAATQGVVPYYGYAHAGHYYGKRSADAEPKADAAYLGYGYPYAYGAYAAHVPFGSSTGLDPITQGLDAATQGVVPYYGYAHAGHYYGKRSADAEPKADAAYLGYGYPYAYGAYAAHVPFGSSTGLDPITQGLDAATQGVVPYYGYAHAGHYYGKRSADAEPKADAAYLGYGYPYAYGGYGYAAHVPFGSSTGLDPITQGLDPVTQGAVPYYGHLGYHYGK